MMMRTPMVATGGPSMQGPAMATGGPSMAGGRPMVASGGPSMMGNPMMQRPGMQPMGSTFGMPQLNRTPMGLPGVLGQFANAFANSWQGSTDNPVRPLNSSNNQSGMVHASMPMRAAPAQPQLNMTPIGHPMQGAARVVNAMAQGRQAANGFPARPLNTNSMGGLMQALLPRRRGGGLY